MAATRALRLAPLDPWGRRSELSGRSLAGQQSSPKEPFEMLRLRTVGLCGLAVLVLSATAAATASAALPEFVGPMPVSFTAKSGVTTLETVKKATITCTSDTASGEVTGPKTGSITITLSGCEFSTVSVPCNTPGVAPGTIVTGPLVMTLGYINEPKHEAGVDLSTATGGPLIEAVCAGLKVTVVGSVIGKIIPVNRVVVPPGHFILKFSQAAGKQKPTHFEAGPIDVLTTSFGGPFAESGLSSTDSISFPTPYKVAA
jgi:hypothetical protein